MGKNPGCLVTRVCMPLMNNLEILRSKYYPTGLHIVDSYRCPVENKRVGGVKFSQHELGTAADIPGTVAHQDVLALNLFTGVGWNRSDGKVVHVDMRPGDPHHPTTWTYPRV